MDCVTVIVKRVYIEVNPLGKSLKGFYWETTTGAGDAFCAGVVSGLTYGKNLADAVEIGTLLAASVITSSENVCPRFQQAELGLRFPD